MISFDLIEHGKPLQQRIRETPTPVGREVLVRVTHVGLCHSDLHFWEGHFDLGGGRKALLKDRGIVPPMTLGHEPLGEVVATGSQVSSSIRIGAKKLVYPWIGCGDCWACAAELDHLCARQRNIGVARPGAFATHLIVPDEKYLVDAGHIPDATAATLACSGLTSYAAAAKLGRLHADDWVAVVGCGGVGLTCLLVLKAMGIQNVLACDIDEAKLQTATQLGAAATLLANRQEALDEARHIAGDRLAGVVDFVGTPSSVGLLYPVLRKGATHVLCGLNGGELSISLPPIAQRSISIVGSFVGTLADLKKIVELVQGQPTFTPPVVVRDATEINRALEDLSAGRVTGRTVLDFSHLTD